MGAGELGERQLLLNSDPGTLRLSGVVGYPKYYIPRRYVMVLLCFLATVVCYWLRTNMSVAIVPMSEKFGWSKKTQGLILASFYFGYILLQIAGSWIATRLGARIVLGTSVFFTSAFTLLTPYAAPQLELMLLCRFFTGIAEAVTYPVIAMLMSEWAAVQERTAFITIIWSGGTLGTVISMLTTSPLMTFLGWKGVFFLNGGCGILWSLIWFAIAANQPHQMVGICDEEIKLIHQPTSAVLPAGVSSNPHERPNVTLSTYAMLLKSIHVWAIIIAHFCSNWGAYVLLNWIPSFMHDRLDFDITHAGFIAVIPYLGLFLVGMVTGKLADNMVKNGIDLSITRKMFGVLGCGIPAFFLIALSFIQQANVAVVCMTLAVSMSGINYSSYGPNMLDIAPKYSGIIMGISNTFGTIPGIVGVYLTGWILEEFNSWAIVFFVAAGVYVVNCITWSLFSTAKRLF